MSFPAHTPTKTNTHSHAHTQTQWELQHLLAQTEKSGNGVKQKKREKRQEGRISSSAPLTDGGKCSLQWWPWLYTHSHALTRPGTPKVLPLYLDSFRPVILSTSASDGVSVRSDPLPHTAGIFLPQRGTRERNGGVKWMRVKQMVTMQAERLKLQRQWSGSGVSCASQDDSFRACASNKAFISSSKNE